MSELAGGVRNFHVSGKVEASSEPQDMRLQRMLGHMPGAGPPATRSRCWSSAAAPASPPGRSCCIPDVERIVICEIEPLIPQVVAPYFAKENYDVVNDPRVQIVYDDARHYMLTTREKFDIITSDPIHPWVKGAATLYTKEYFELVRRASESRRGGHAVGAALREHTRGGQERDGDVLRGVSRTARSGATTIRGRLRHRPARRSGMTAHSTSPMRWSGCSPRRAREVRASLSGVGYESILDVLGTYAGHASDLKEWLKDAEINRDRNLRLQYLAGLENNQYQADAIYRQILAQRRAPDAHFTADPATMQALRARLGQPDLDGR